MWRCKARCGWWQWSGGYLLSVNSNDFAVNQVLNRIPQCITAVSRVSHNSMEVAEETCVVPMRKRTWRWADLRKPQEGCNLGKDCTQRFNQLSVVTLSALRSSWNRLYLLGWWSKLHWSGDRSDVWSVCPRCWSIHHLARTRLSHHIDWHGTRLNICNRGFQRISLPRNVVTIVATTATIVVFGQSR